MTGSSYRKQVQHSPIQARKPAMPAHPAHPFGLPPIRTPRPSPALPLRLERWLPPPRPLPLSPTRRHPLRPARLTPPIPPRIHFPPHLRLSLHSHSPDRCLSDLHPGGRHLRQRQQREYQLWQRYHVAFRQFAGCARLSALYSKRSEWNNYIGKTIVVFYQQ